MAPVFCETEAGAELQAEAFPVLLRLPSVENPADIPPGIIGIPGRDDDLSNVCCKKGRQVGPKVNPVMAIYGDKMSVSRKNKIFMSTIQLGRSRQSNGNTKMLTN